MQRNDFHVCQILLLLIYVQMVQFSRALFNASAWPVGDIVCVLVSSPQQVGLHISSLRAEAQLDNHSLPSSPTTISLHYTNIPTYCWQHPVVRTQSNRFQ